MPETCKWTVLYLVLSQISFVTVMTLRLALRLERIWNAYKLLVNQSNHNHPSYFWGALSLAGHCCLQRAAPWHWAVAKPFISGWFVLRGALIQAAVDVFAGQKYCGHTNFPLCLGLDEMLVLLDSCPDRMMVSHACWPTSVFLHGQVYTALLPGHGSSSQDALLCFILDFSLNISSCTSKSLMPLRSLSNSRGILSFSFLFNKMSAADNTYAPLAIL